MTRTIPMMLIGVLLIVLAGCTTEPASRGNPARRAGTSPPQLPGRPVAAGERYDADNIDIHAPDSPGWRLGESSRNVVIYGRRGPGPDETWVATVAGFDVPSDLAPDDRQGFLAYVEQRYRRRQIDGRSGTDGNPPDVVLSSARSYPCVRVHDRYTDYVPASGAGASLITQFAGLYCRHPSTANAGFSIVFSHRGQAVAPDFRREAQDFIDHVTLPSPGRRSRPGPSALAVATPR